MVFMRFPIRRGDGYARPNIFRPCHPHSARPHRDRTISSLFPNHTESIPCSGSYLEIHNNNKLAPAGHISKSAAILAIQTGCPARVGDHVTPGCRSEAYFRLEETRVQNDMVCIICQAIGKVTSLTNMKFNLSAERRCVLYV